MKITFADEAGIDSGGLSKEFFSLVSKEIQIYSGSAGLDILCETEDGGLYFQSSGGGGGGDQQAGTRCTIREFFRFVGRFVSKALFDRQLIDFPLSLPLLRRMLVNKLVPTESEYQLFDHAVSNVALLVRDLEVHLSDLKTIDQPLHDSLQWILKNDISNVIYETFSVVAVSSSSASSNTNGGQAIIKGANVDLCLHGSKIEVCILSLGYFIYYSSAFTLSPYFIGY